MPDNTHLNQLRTTQEGARRTDSFSKYYEYLRWQAKQGTLMEISRKPGTIEVN